MTFMTNFRVGWIGHLFTSNTVEGTCTYLFDFIFNFLFFFVFSFFFEKALIINCFLFPLIISWDPLSAWNLSVASSTQDSQVATAALKRYTQLWIFGSSEITIYIWSTATVTQIFLIGPALYKYCSKSKQEQQPTNNSDEKIVLFAVPATFYGIFLASFVALVSSNPFVFIIAAIVLLVNKLMFYVRCKLSATRSKYVSRLTSVYLLSLSNLFHWSLF